jgi:uncharacterized SAM-binding protein YcdF (DUF218 family)
MIMQRRKMIVLVIPAAMLLTCIFLFMARTPLLQAAGDVLVVEDDLVPADVIHVLSGPDYRTDYATQLYEEGYGEQLFFTGGWCDSISENHAERGGERALEGGVPPEAIVIDGSSVTGTYSEAIRLKELVARSQGAIRSVILVSDPYHMRRVRWAFRQVMGDQIRLQMAPVPFDLSFYQHQWWKDPYSRKMVRDEYLKTAYYYARYQLTWGPVQEWLASLDQD